MRALLEEAIQGERETGTEKSETDAYIPMRCSRRR